MDGMYRVAYHKPCQHNELLALHNRHLIDRTYIPFDNDYWKEQSRIITKSWRFHPTTMSYYQVAMAYRGGKRRIYMRAREDLLTNSDRKSDAYVKMFVKPDRYPEETIEEKMPRAIQYRHPRYNLALATYLKPFEHEFYNHPGLGPSESRVITKGLNPTEIADLFIVKSAQFKRPLYLACDHSKFDSTIRVEHLKTEHGIYRRSFPKNGRLHSLLRRQIHNTGFTRSNIKYEIKGTRMSGDYNTGLGNSLINRIVLESYLKHIKHEIMLDGDDSVVIIEQEDYQFLDPDHFGKMGFETQVDITSDITQVVYCQRRLVLGAEAVMVRDPIRALSHMAVCFANVQGKGCLRWLRGVAYCEYYSNRNQPIFRAFSGVDPRRLFKTYDWYEKMAGVKIQSHDSIERLAFYVTWGITPDEQVILENKIHKYFDPLILSLTPDIVSKDNVIKEEKSVSLTAGCRSYGTLYPGPNESWDEHCAERVLNCPNAQCVTAATPPCPTQGTAGPYPQA